MPERAMAEEGSATEKKRGAKRPPMPCSRCGRPYARERQVKRLKEKIGQKAAAIDHCPACRQEAHAKALVKAFRVEQTAK